MEWELVSITDLSQANNTRNLKVATLTPYTAVKAPLIRVIVNSQSAKSKPTWVTGGVIKWGFDSIYGIQRWNQSVDTSIDVNRETVVRTPPEIVSPLFSLEIPYWIRDASVFIWQLKNPQSVYKDPNMTIYNPIEFPAPAQPGADSANASTMYEVLSTDTYFELLAPNANRKGFIVKNESADKFLFLILSADGDAIKTPVVLQAGGVYEDTDGFYTGVVRGFMEANTVGQKILATEFYRAA